MNAQISKKNMKVKSYKIIKKYINLIIKGYIIMVVSLFWDIFFWIIIILIDKL